MTWTCGYLLAHKAFQEDVDSSGQPNPDTPGYALVSLDQDKPDNAFRAWVVYQAQFLEKRLTGYNTTHGKILTLPDVRRKFLMNPPTTDTLFLFTYTLARLMNINESPDHTRTNAFAGQLEMNILFDITLVIEESIKHKNPSKHRPDGRKLTFVHQGDYLLATAGHPLTLVSANGQPVNTPQLGYINSLFEDDTTFDATLQAAVDGTVTKGPNPTLDRLQCDVALAYGIRNHAAHNTDTAPTIWNRFDEVQQALFRVLFATIEHLY